MRPVNSSDMVTLQRYEMRDRKWTPTIESYDCSYSYSIQLFLSDKRIDAIFIDEDFLQVCRHHLYPWEDDKYCILFHDKENIPHFLKLLQQQQGDLWDSINIIEK